MSSRAIYITAAISGVITVILVLAFVYVRRHREKWTIMSFAAAVLFGFATVAQVALAAAPAPAGSNGQGTPRPSSSSAGTAISSPTPVDLSYQLSASLGIPRTVNVKAQATGQPEPGLTYWFVLEVDYGKEYIEYYPRQKMSGGPTSFDVTIPPNAETKYVRTGRIYGLDSAQNAQAEVRLERQGASGKDDYFEKAIGKPVSNAVQLPF